MTTATTRPPHRSKMTASDKNKHSSLPIIETATAPKRSVERIAYKVSEASIALGVDKGTVYDLIHAGKLRYTRLAGGTILIPVAALDEYLNGDVA